MSFKYKPLPLYEVLEPEWNMVETVEWWVSYAEGALLIIGFGILFYINVL